MYQKKPLTFVITSRGCPYRCAFCSVHVTFGDTYRRRKIENIINEILFRYQQGYKVFDFEDDNLTFDLAETKEICRRLGTLFPPGAITCTGMNGISYVSLDCELLQLMHRAGFNDLNVSLVSLDQDVLSGHRRMTAFKKYTEIIQTAYDLKFRIVSYQILGLPDDTMESMMQTMAVNSRLPVLMGVSPFYLTPRMPLAERFPPLTPESMVTSRLTALGYSGSGHPRDDLYTLLVTARIINFLKGLEFRKPALSFNDVEINLTHRSKRIECGLRLLDLLRKEKVLYAESSAGLKILEKFNTLLFFDLWQKLEYITTRVGCRIHVPEG